MEKSQRQNIRDKKLAHWLISSKMPMKMLLSGQFDAFIGALHYKNKNEYAVSRNRLEKVIQAEHNRTLMKLSHLLQKIQYISLLVSKWKVYQNNGGYQNILLLSIFFIDNQWNKKSYVIAIEPLNAEDNSK